MSEPRLLSRTQCLGLLKVGDILIPGDGPMPSFSACRCVAEIDRMIPYMNDSDRDGFKMLLILFRYLPACLVRAIMALSERQALFPGPLGAPLRMINIGIKGAVMTLYYSDVGDGPGIHEQIGWDATVVERQPAEKAGD